MSTYQKVKIIVAGDSGVGKTALVNLLCYDKFLTNPNWTIGAQVEIKFHDYQVGTPNQLTFGVELWDIGGYKNHRSSRSIFYPNTDGVILIYDVTNKKSEHNLNEWLHEILSCNPYYKHDKVQEEGFLPVSYLGDNLSGSSEWSRRSNSSSSSIPVLVIGTHLDQIPSKQGLQIIDHLKGCFAETNRYEEIILSTMSADCLAPGCNNAVVIDRFFDQVFDYKTQISTNIDISSSRSHGENYSNKRHVSIRIDKND